MTADDARALVALAPAHRVITRKEILAAAAKAPPLPSPAPSRAAKAPRPKPIRSPWLRAMAKRSPDEARAELARHWKNVPRWLRPLRDALLASRIVGASDGEHLEVHHEATDRSYWIAPPVPEAARRRAFAALGFSPKHLLADLVAAFDGLRDWPADHAGGLVSITKMTTVARARRNKNAWVIRSIDADELRGMHDAAIVYEAGTGDLLLASPAGPIAWARHDSNEIEPAGRDLAAFLKGYGYGIGLLSSS
jgi:hypothetical protein